MQAMPWVLRGSYGGGRFLMSEVPVCTEVFAPFASLQGDMLTKNGSSQIPNLVHQKETSLKTFSNLAKWLKSNVLPRC